MSSELCKTCAHKNVCMLDKNLVGDTFVMGNPCFFDNEKLYKEHLKREKEGFPCSEHLPADVVPVVRCKNCKHSKHWYGNKNLCDMWAETGIDVWKDGYCNYGERKTDGTIH